MNLLQEPRPYTHFQSKFESNIHHFYISETVGDPQHYAEMIHIIRYSSEFDTIFIHINTVGGNAFTAIQLVQAMRESQAHIITSIEGQCFSAGTLIFLSGKEYVVQPHSMMMLHNYSSGIFGKGHEQRAQFEAQQKWFYKFMEEAYSSFVTPDEFNKIVDGGDLWLDSQQVVDRLNTMIEARDADMEKMLEEMDNEHECCPCVDNINETTPLYSEVLNQEQDDLVVKKSPKKKTKK